MLGVKGTAKKNTEIAGMQDLEENQVRILRQTKTEYEASGERAGGL